MNNIDLTVVITAYCEPLEKIEFAIKSAERINANQIILICDFFSDEFINQYHKLANKHQIPFYSSNTKKGVSSSRNLGIHVAKSRYITFLDGDDCLDNRFVNKFLEFEKENYDFFLFNIQTKCNYCINTFKVPLDYFICYKKTSNTWKSLLKEMFIVLNDKHIFRTNFLIENSILFDERFYKGEDALFMAKCLNCFSSFICIDEALQQYNFYRKTYSLDDAINELKSINECRLVFSDLEIQKYYQNSLFELFKSRFFSLKKQKINVNNYYKLLASFKFKNNSFKNKLILLIFKLKLNNIYYFYYKIKNRNNDF